MYLVTIKNGEEEYIINEASSNSNNRIIGKIKQGINTINSFEFTIYPNNIGFDKIKPYKTVIEVLNTKTNKYEFKGRVLTLTSDMESNGLISKTYVCESELAYLLDTVQMWKKLQNETVEGYLKRLLKTHNEKVPMEKQFQVGNVTVVDNNDSIYRYIAYETTKKNIDDDLIGKLGGELQVRYEGDVRYLDYLEEIGEKKETEIRLAKNIKDISSEINPAGFYTRIFPLGYKTSNDANNEARLTIEKVNGTAYIDDEEAIAEFGIIEGFITYDDVKEAKKLVTKGKNYLASQKILTSNKVNALDLSLIGIDIDSFEVGNYYPLKHELLGIDYYVRIVEKTISIENPRSTEITLGERKKDIKTYQLEAKNNATQASNVTTTLERIDSDIATNNQVTTALGEAVSIMREEIEMLKTEIQTLKGGEGDNE